MASTERVFIACENNPTCSANFPDLADRFRDLVAQLNASPISVDTVDPTSGDVKTIQMSGTTLIRVIFLALYSTEHFSEIPTMIAQLELGDTTGFATIAAAGSSDLLLGTIPNAMDRAVVCHDMLAFTTLDQWNEAATGDPVYDDIFHGGTDGYRNITDICDVLDAGTAPPGQNKLVSADTPTLLLSGGFDHVTPVANGDAVAAKLSQSRHIVFPSHVVIAEPCGHKLLHTFLDDPNTALDIACVAESAPPEFFRDPNRMPSFVEVSIPETVTLELPEEWADLGEGFFINDGATLHQAALLVATSTPAEADTAATAILEEFDLLADFVAGETVIIAGREWQTLTGEAPDGQVTMWFSEIDAQIVFVTVFTAPAERDWVHEHVVPTILSTVTPLSQSDSAQRDDNNS